jgi:uncharacterized membrane protein YjjB (DUF3815 family)
LPGLSPFVATMAGLIVLLPGFTLTVAMSELARGHLASGSTRLLQATVVFLVLGFGVLVGSRLGALLGSPVPAPAPVPPGAWTEAVALLAAPAALGLIFQAHPRHLPWILVGGWLAYASARAGAVAFGPEVGAVGGAFLLGLYANGLSRARDLPATVALVPSIMLLVPGSIGLRAVSLLAGRDALEGIEAAFTATLVAVALAVGLLLANAALPTRRALEPDA